MYAQDAYPRQQTYPRTNKHALTSKAKLKKDLQITQKLISVFENVLAEYRNFCDAYDKEHFGSNPTVANIEAYQRHYARVLVVCDLCNIVSKKSHLYPELRLPVWSLSENNCPSASGNSVV